MDKEALIKLIGLGIITGGEDFLEDMKKELGIDDETKCEESQEKIDARFLRGKQDEIDSLRKESERQKWKADKYSNLYAEQVEKYEELEKDLKTAQDGWESRDRIISKIYSLIEYHGLSDVKKIGIIRKVIKADNGEIEPDQDVKDFHSMKYRNKGLQN